MNLFKRIRRKKSNEANQELNVSSEITHQLDGLLADCKQISVSKSEGELNENLENIFSNGDHDLPWTGDFDEFMSNPENRLAF